MKAYIVKTEGDVEGRTSRTLGYVTGEKIDILNYFEPDKYYSLYVDEIEIKHIDGKAAQLKAQLVTEQAELEKRLAEIKSRLK